LPRTRFFGSSSQVLQRHVKRPKLSWFDRAIMVATSSITATWREVVLIVKPETILRWHREGFRLFWRWKTRTLKRQSRITPEVINLIRRMADENRLWGAERIRGELPSGPFSQLMTVGAPV
jgi:hypothetical protein